ncbi:MAG TPA: hypothetical protein PLZ57_07290 [Pseudobdellovibrionaceae bacterium]|nr:hypothetical protein [Pseudobdellovibrionaceae bacterium]
MPKPLPATRALLLFISFTLAWHIVPSGGDFTQRARAEERTPLVRATPSVRATPEVRATPAPRTNSSDERPPRINRCESVDLREERCPNGASRIPAARDQLRTNYCFANTLADVYSYNDCVNYSALHLGLSSHLQDRRDRAANPRAEPLKSNSLNLGASVESTNELIRRAGGLCLEENFSSRRRELMHPAQLERFLQSFATPAGQSRLSRACSPRQPGGLEIATTRRRDVIAQYQEAQPNIPNAHRIDGPLGLTIHEALNERQPAMINFASLILSGPPEPAKPGQRPEEPSQPDHYSSIVGRREINGRCHLLVRDSNPVSNSRWPRDGQLLLIPEDALLPHINEVAVPQPRSPLAPLPQVAATPSTESQAPARPTPRPARSSR